VVKDQSLTTLTTLNAFRHPSCFTDVCPTLKNGVDGFEWAQHFFCELLLIPWNGPHCHDPHN
jgi:hypothetical protein